MFAGPSQVCHLQNRTPNATSSMVPGQGPNNIKRIFGQASNAPPPGMQSHDRRVGRLPAGQGSSHLRSKSGQGPGAAMPLRTAVVRRQGEISVTTDLDAGGADRTARGNFSPIPARRHCFTFVDFGQEATGDDGPVVLNVVPTVGTGRAGIQGRHPVDGGRIPVSTRLKQCPLGPLHWTFLLAC